MSFKSFIYNCVNSTTEMCRHCGNIQEIPIGWDRSYCGSCHKMLWDLRP